MLSKKYEVITLKDKSISEIKETLQKIPNESLVFLFGRTKDKMKERQYTPEENAMMISSFSPVPVYTFWDLHLNTGVIGGNIIRGEDQGKKAAEITIRILNGEKADNIPVVMETPTKTIFDYKVMQRFGISINQLPKGSILINQPINLWELYRRYIVFGIVTFLVMAFLIVLLLFNIKQRKRAMAILNEERLLLDKKVEERTYDLQKANESLKILWIAIEQMPLSVILTDKDGNITYVNPAFTETTGYSKEEAFGKNPSELFRSHTHNPDFYKNIWDTILNKNVWSREICNKKKDGTLFWEQATIVPIIIDDKIAHFVAIKQDITEKKNTERLREDVERIMRHDLKGPLNAIINISQLLSESEILTTSQRHDLLIIKQAGEIMLEQVNMSLNIFKIEDKTYDLKPSPLNIYEIISNAVEIVSTISQAKNITIKIKSNNIPSPELEKLNILGEKILCINIFHNLLKNAIEASPKDHEISIDIDKTDNSVLVSITNEGTVFQDIKNTFFEKYVTHGKHGGTGIGTYSAKIMTEVQGGKISLNTEQTDKIIVTVELPLAT